MRKTLIATLLKEHPGFAIGKAWLDLVA